jgi:hypothetical protein
VNGPITKYDINRTRLSLIKQEIFRQFDSYNEFRQEMFPDIKLNTFRQWFKKPYYISDRRLCLMEDSLGITPAQVRARLTEEFNLPSRLLQVAKGIIVECIEPQLT